MAPPKVEDTLIKVMKWPRNIKLHQVARHMEHDAFELTEVAVTNFAERLVVGPRPSQLVITEADMRIGGVNRRRLALNLD